MRLDRQILKKKRSKRLFTLLEVMVAMVLLVIASGTVGWKMYGAIQKKKFQSELDRVRSRLSSCQRLAVAMQADWRGSFKKKGQEWIFEVSCEEGAVKKLLPLVLHSSILLDGKKIDELVIDFFASGQVLPTGVLSFSQKSDSGELKLSEIFQRREGKKLGPIHPEEAK